MPAVTYWVLISGECAVTAERAQRYVLGARTQLLAREHLRALILLPVCWPAAVAEWNAAPGAYSVNTDYCISPSPFPIRPARIVLNNLARSRCPLKKKRTPLANSFCDAVSAPQWILQQGAAFLYSANIGHNYLDFFCEKPSDSALFVFLDNYWQPKCNLTVSAQSLPSLFSLQHSHVFMSHRHAI